MTMTRQKQRLEGQQQAPRRTIQIVSRLVAAVGEVAVHKKDQEHRGRTRVEDTDKRPSFRRRDQLQQHGDGCGAFSSSTGALRIISLCLSTRCPTQSIWCQPIYKLRSCCSVVT